MLESCNAVVVKKLLLLVCGSGAKLPWFPREAGAGKCEKLMVVYYSSRRGNGIEYLSNFSCSDSIPSCRNEPLLCRIDWFKKVVLGIGVKLLLPMFIIVAATVWSAT